MHSSSKAKTLRCLFRSWESFVASNPTSRRQPSFRLMSSNSCKNLLTRDLYSSIWKRSGFPVTIYSKRFIASESELKDDAISEEAAVTNRTTQEVKEDLRQLHHIRALVSQLYLALHVPEEYQAEMEAMKKQLDQIQTELQPLEERKIQLLTRAERRSTLLAWAGLGFMGMQFGFLARLTWWEYSWDIIEPVTYFVTYGTAMALYSYFLVTRQDYSFPGVTERWTAVAFHKNARRNKWEMSRYMELQEKLRQLENDLEKMNMLSPRPLAKAASTTSDTDLDNNRGGFR